MIKEQSWTDSANPFFSPAHQYQALSSHVMSIMISRIQHGELMTNFRPAYFLPIDHPHEHVEKETWIISGRPYIIGQVWQTK